MANHISKSGAKNNVFALLVVHERHRMIVKNMEIIGKKIQNYFVKNGIRTHALSDQYLKLAP
jgi:hypothetical protein